MPVAIASIHSVDMGLEPWIYLNIFVIMKPENMLNEVKMIHIYTLGVQNFCYTCDH